MHICLTHLAGTRISNHPVDWTASLTLPRDTACRPAGQSEGLVAQRSGEATKIHSDAAAVGYHARRRRRGPILPPVK